MSLARTRDRFLEFRPNRHQTRSVTWLFLPKSSPSQTQTSVVLIVVVESACGCVFSDADAVFSAKRVHTFLVEHLLSCNVPFLLTSYQSRRCNATPQMIPPTVRKGANATVCVALTCATPSRHARQNIFEFLKRDIHSCRKKDAGTWGERTSAHDACLAFFTVESNGVYLRYQITCLS